jgi:hypothetical protein
VSKIIQLFDLIDKTAWKRETEISSSTMSHERDLPIDVSAWLISKMCPDFASTRLALIILFAGLIKTDNAHIRRTTARRANKIA